MGRWFFEIALATSAAALLASCDGSAGLLPASGGTASNALRASGPFPPACTVPKVKSGSDVTSVAAFGNITNGKFALAQPSSWTEVEWLKVPPPGAAHISAPRSPRGKTPYYIYFGNYAVSDGTNGCLYVVTSIDGKPIDSHGNAALTGQPRIPPTGATLPVGAGFVSMLHLTVKSDGTGSGSMVLVHYDGSKALTGTLSIAGRVKTN